MTACELVNPTVVAEAMFMLLMVFWDCCDAISVTPGFTVPKINGIKIVRGSDPAGVGFIRSPQKKKNSCIRRWVRCSRPAGHSHQHSRQWSLRVLIGREVSGKGLLVFGTRRIGIFREQVYILYVTQLKWPDAGEAHKRFRSY